MSPSYLEEVLVACPVPKALARALYKAWKFTTERGRLLFNRLYENKPSRPSADSGESLLAYLTGLVSQGEKVTKGISILGIEKSGQVAHAHSLFCVSAGDYAEPDLWGVLGMLPDEGKPDYINLTPLHLALRYSFLGVSRTEYESALTGLSTEGEDLDDLVQEPADEADDSLRRICARGA